MGPKAKPPPPPKGKGAPAEPAAKGAPGEAPPEAGGGGGGIYSKIPPNILWSTIGVIAVISLAALILMTYLYLGLAAQKKHPLDDPMKKLRSTMAIGLRSPQLNYENPLKVAEEVVKLPTHIERAEKDFKDRKVKYLTLFKKGVRSSGGWQLFGRSFYYISKGQKTWYDAENFCLSRDSHLASILSEEEQNYINSQLKQSTWIGLSDEEVEGNWEWTDGSSLTTQYWSDGHPRPTWESGEEEKDCAFIEPLTGGPNWSEANCHEVKQWVCKETLEVKRP